MSAPAPKRLYSLSTGPKTNVAYFCCDHKIINVIADPGCPMPTDVQIAQLEAAAIVLNKTQPSKKKSREAVHAVRDSWGAKA